MSLLCMSNSGFSTESDLFANTHMESLKFCIIDLLFSSSSKAFIPVIMCGSRGVFVVSILTVLFANYTFNGKI